MPKSKAKFKNIGTFQKESPFFREEKRKAGQVRLAGIHLCFGEVGIGRYGSRNIGAYSFIRR